ncbi:MAG: PDZ domain-containing protein [Bacteroidota bacterium]
MKSLFSLLLLCLGVAFLNAQVNARLFQQPDVSDTHIAFSYGGDIWIVAKTGGLASKLSSAKGNEGFPRFSPDGSQIAFSGNYDGNTDIYVIPSLGGVPVRATHHGMNDRIIDWYPDGKHLLYASSMESGKQRFSQFYKIPSGGGLPEKLPIAYGEFASVSPDASKVAYTDRSRIFRTWKRYRGGTAADVWLFDLNTLESENITDNTANDELPMWMGDKIYYLSDNGPAQRFNIWSYDLKSKTRKQVTKFKDVDVHFPNNGKEEIVFEAGGKLHLLNIATEEVKAIDVQVVTDLVAIKPKKESAKRYMQNMAISPDGKRAIVEARGEVFSLPSEKGITKNLTQTSGVAERFPAWSPNGKYIAYWSDQSGEYELTVRDLSEDGKEEKLTSLGAGFRYNLYWSPDSEKLAYVDQTMTIQIYDMKNKVVVPVEQDISLFEGGLRNWRCSWSPDSRWMAYTKNMNNNNSAIFLYDMEAKKSKQITKGFYSDSNPTFDPEGKYLYLTTNRDFSPVYGDFDNSWTYPNATQLAVITLSADTESPIKLKNDTVEIEEEEEEKKEDEEEEKSEKKKEDDKAVAIDLEGFERRIVVLPPSAGNMGNLAATKGKIVYSRYPNSGSGGGESKLMYYDLEEQKSKTIMSGVWTYKMSANGEKLLVRTPQGMGIIKVQENQKMEDQLPLDKMEMVVDPRAEWQQIFNDAWRFQRDYFYDKEMHGLDWEAMKKQYGNLVQYANNRNDLNFILGELIGELNASHTYRGGGDQEYADRKSIGYLGVDWAKEGDYFKVKTIIRGSDWDNEVRSPLDEPGVKIKEGSYIIAVNGVNLNDYTDPWAAFEGLANETVEITYNDKPSMEDAETTLVKTLSSETRLRNLAWIESNRKRVEEASGGKIGYIYVPSTGIDGQNELVRQFYGQWDKQGLIVDERFNNGGQIPDRFIELLNRKPLAYWAVRDGKNWQWPPVGHFGSMAMMINGWSGSGGDAFPDYFKKAGLGPLVGGRTWGGLIGISGAPTLIDGGVVTVPTFRMYNPDGTWFKEGYGVDPDIEVKEDPTQLAKGVDTQLEKSIEVVLEQIETKGEIHPKEPKKEDRSRVIRP